MSEAQKPNGEFAAILNQAGAIDKDAETALTGPKPEGQAATEVIDPVAAWASIPAAVGSILTMALPEVKDAYKPENCRAWGQAMHRLAIKRKWSTDGLPPEVDVAMASAMFLVPTVLAIKVRKTRAEAERKVREAGGLPENQGASGEATAT